MTASATINNNNNRRTTTLFDVLRHSWSPRSNSRPQLILAEVCSGVCRKELRWTQSAEETKAVEQRANAFVQKCSLQTRLHLCASSAALNAVGRCTVLRWIRPSNGHCFRRQRQIITSIRKIRRFRFWFRSHWRLSENASQEGFIEILGKFD